LFSVRPGFPQNKKRSKWTIPPQTSSFLPVYLIKKIRSFGFWAFTPNPSAQNPKRKKKF